ncbi:hypothetical protein K458DRAFT_444857 [Lentithecium fluviatile CBS 122367]|uniref:NACHT domain-containing protein n=1 Tax=Lentithecium fluviatile CBS 122367 TaxID=1168545 RepID=A0A6G1IS72_9PLEO|nr:hypothetical protein K458DRAFT_444857 [Lentithecium fluviatile CBS 122367]
MPRMKPVVSALARQTITAAFEDLERTVSPADAREMRSCTALGHVRTAALDIEKQLGARQALRNMRRLAPLLNGLEHYAKVVDVLCNGTPMVSWIWSPIILILRVASEYVEAFEQLMKGYARIATALSRFELLSNTFSDPDFQHSLAVYYADILQFHKHAYKFVRRSGWRLLFLTSWGRFQRRFDNILDDLERHGDLIDRAASARNVSETRQLRQDICSWKEESLEQVKRDEEHQADKQYRSILSWLRVDETEQLSIYESIFEEGSKFPGTCAWMVKNGKIASWLQRKPSSNLLWLQGNPGSGKSVMSTQLVNFLRTSSLFVMSHFCSQTYATTTRYEAILRSLLHQLLRRNGELVAYTYQEYVVGKRLPATSNLEQLIETLLDALSDAGHTEYVWVIIDGIEDCELARQARLITFLGQIAKPGMHGGTVCKVLVSSRAHPIRLKRIWQKQVVSLSDENETEQLTKAIKLYASQRLRLLNERLQQLELNADEVEAVEEMVAQKAAGMFLYARLVLDYLGTNIFYSGDELKQSIHQLPETITEFYRNLLAQMLSRLDPRSVDRIRCTLSWIAYAKRPLKRLELLSALAFSSGNPHVSSPAPRYTLELCSPLVEERRDTTLSFVHASVKDPVTINPDHAVHEHGLASVSCLLAATTVFGKDFHQEPTLLRLVKGVHALHIYSTEYWTEYLFAIAATVHGLEAFPALISLAYSLTEALELLSDTRVSQLVASSGAVDDRLSFLDRHPRVKRQIERALWARSAKRLESEILEPSCPYASATRADFDGVSKMLDVYQKAVEVILDQDSCAGASTEELELFKSQFRTSAYTCRLRSCPRATVGFDSGLLRHEHEIGHAGGFQCSFPGCHYPPFRTKQSLDSHGEKCHASNPARKSIRRLNSASVTFINSFTN